MRRRSSKSGGEPPFRRRSISREASARLQAPEIEPSKNELGPSREIYGFVLYVASWLAFVVYLIYGFTPDPVLHSWGITYYPQKWWAIAVPTYLCSLYVFIQVFYVALNMMRTPPLDSMATLVDEYTCSEATETTWPQDAESIPPIVDIPIGRVNGVLYGGKTAIPQGLHRSE
eukprot:comp17657_c0_seq1/m.17445 comp17657_c0_seq1/g.17445  ORF comp17657_c0_seq1/g.17445 comp17657_c0_seq1/m.17445 type:complete len:173 (-) comp17657_c0_seq1:310-828(-)